MSDVDTNITTDTVLIDTNYQSNNYATFTNSSDLSQKGYVDLLYTQNMQLLSQNINDLRMDFDGITGSYILADYDSIIEISNKLLDFGILGITGITGITETLGNTGINLYELNGNVIGVTGNIYALFSKYALDVSSMNTTLSGLTGSIQNEKVRAKGITDILYYKLQQEQIDFISANNNEINTRLNTDKGLTGTLQTAITTRQNDLASEEKTRQDSDTLLQQNVNNFSTSNTFKLSQLEFGSTGINEGTTGGITGPAYFYKADFNLNNVKYYNYSFNQFNKTYNNSTFLSNNAQQGYVVRMSKNGTTVAIGNPTDATNLGSVSIYVKTAGVWQLQPDSAFNYKLCDTSLISSKQGFSLAMSQNGNILAVGAPNSSGGSVVIWARSNGVWSKAQNITNSSTVNFGYSVDISADGNTLLISDPGNSSDKGKIYIYTLSGSSYTYLTSFEGSNTTTGDKFGFYSCIAGDGKTIAVGAPFCDSNKGAFWIYYKDSNSGWIEQAIKKQSVSNYSQSNQGVSLSLSYTGNVLAVGAAKENSVASNTLGKGSVWIWSSDGSSWTQVTKLYDANAVNFASFGCSVSLTTDAKVLAVGGNYEDTVGAVWIFKEVNGTWSQSGSKITYNSISSNPNSDVSSFGNSVSFGGLPNNGLVIGAFGNTSTYAKGVAFLSVPVITDLNPTNSDPYFIKLSDKWRITPNSTFTSLIFQKLENNVWNEKASLNKV